jgi:hypothetical protein
VRLPSVGESREARRIGAERGPELVARAALLVVCDDCHARLGTITWVDGRPWAALVEQGNRLDRVRRTRRYRNCVWADRGSVLHARIGGHRHVLNLDDVLAQLPAQGKPRAKMHVRH